MTVIALLGPWIDRDEVSLQKKKKTIATSGQPWLLPASDPTLVHSP